MQTILDLAQACKAGRRPVVTFKKAIEDKECYPEAGMRGRLVDAILRPGDDVLVLRFEFDDFLQHNQPLESSTYFDDRGVPCLTAHQAGFYKPVEDIYFDKGELIADLMELESDEALALFERYKASGSTLSYVAWLEQQLLSSMAQAKP